MQIIQYWRHNDTDTIKRFTYLFKHSLSSWFFKQLRGSSCLQWEHSVGSSDMAFSTAKLREQILRFISVRQFGQVDCSFFSRLSAKRCVKQDAHIRCPLRHYVETEKKLMSKSHKICTSLHTVEEWARNVQLSVGNLGKNRTFLSHLMLIVAC